MKGHARQVPEISEPTIWSCSPHYLGNKGQSDLENCMTTEKLPPKILIVESGGAAKIFREAVLLWVEDGVPVYGSELDQPTPDRLTTDTNRALDLIGKTLEPESGSLS